MMQLNIAIRWIKPLGKEYLDIFKEGINDGWIDIYENKGKTWWSIFMGWI